MSEETNLDDLSGWLGAAIDVDERGFGPVYPYIQWVNGNPKGQKDTIQQTGGFFFSADQGAEPPPGFEPYTFINDEGEEIKGFAAKEIKVSPIRFRRCWLSRDEAGELIDRFNWDDYDTAKSVGSATGLCHILAEVNDAEDPYVLSFKGTMSRAVMGMGRDRGIIPVYGTKICAMASKLRYKKTKVDQKFPLCAFSLKIRGETDKKGKPVYTKVGSGQKSSNVVMPVWSDEPEGKVDDRVLKSLFVGGETFGELQAIHRTSEEWANAWDNLSQRNEERSGAPQQQGADGTPGAQDAPF